MRKFLHLIVAISFVAAGCSSDDDTAEDPASTTAQSEEQTTDESDADPLTSEAEAESTGAEAPDGMLEACNGANFYTDPGDVPEADISSEEERTAIQQTAALSQPISGFEVVQESSEGEGIVGFGQSDGWAWFCIYAPEADGPVFYAAFQAITVDGIAAPEDGRWDSVDLG